MTMQAPFPADYMYRGCSAHNHVGYQAECAACRIDANRGYTEDDLANCHLAPRQLVAPGCELLPCPFCGGVSEIDNLTDPDDFFVSCTQCEVQQIANYTRDEAIRRWNQRSGGAR